jgi:signal transduction histidine kinase
MQTARGYSLGAVDYILSPVVPEVLRSKVRVFVELHILQRRIARQADERIALAASEAALKVAEETTRRSTMLSELSHALAGLIDIGAGMHTLLEHVVPALASAATLAILDEQHQVQRVMRRHRPADGEAQSVEMAPAALPTLSLVALQRALEQPVERRQGSPPLLAGAAGQMLPLVHGERVLGALWIDGEMTDLGRALLDEVASRAAIAFASARLYGNLQIEINERRQAEARLEESARRKDEFLAMLSHELRTPLAPIRNAVELIRLIAPADAKLKWAADVTDRQVRQLARLVDELLDVARIRQGKIVLQTDTLDLVALITQCVETQRPIVAARRLALSMALPGAPLWVRGDGTRLAQVVNNLVANATKYTLEGGSISVALERDGAEAVFSVRDDGIGIEPELLPNVFELFMQGKRSLDRNQGGLGVGLTLVHRLVKLHGGHVEAISEGPGRGAEFRVVLPCLLDADDARLGGETGASPLAAIVSRRILVVDDNTWPTPEAPAAPPPQGGAASGPAEPDPRRPLGGAGSSVNISSRPACPDCSP